MFTIEVDYTTGNSFNSERQIEEIGLCFTTRRLAREALQVIKEHLALVQEKEEVSSWSGYKGRSYSEISAQGLSKNWCKQGIICHNKEYGTNLKGSGCDWEYYVAVRVTEDEYRMLNVTMWTGYFETLHGAKVICFGDDEDSLIFD